MKERIALCNTARSADEFIQAFKPEDKLARFYHRSGKIQERNVQKRRELSTLAFSRLQFFFSLNPTQAQMRELLKDHEHASNMNSITYWLFLESALIEGVFKSSLEFISFVADLDATRSNEKYAIDTVAAVELLAKRLQSVDPADLDACFFELSLRFPPLSFYKFIAPFILRGRIQYESLAEMAGCTSDLKNCLKLFKLVPISIDPMNKFISEFPSGPLKEAWFRSLLEKNTIKNLEFFTSLEARLEFLRFFLNENPSFKHVWKLMKEVKDPSLWEMADQYLVEKSLFQGLARELIWIRLYPGELKRKIDRLVSVRPSSLREWFELYGESLRLKNQDAVDRIFTGLLQAFYSEEDFSVVLRMFEEYSEKQPLILAELKGKLLDHGWGWQNPQFFEFLSAGIPKPDHPQFNQVYALTFEMFMSFWEWQFEQRRDYFVHSIRSGAGRHFILLNEVSSRQATTRQSANIRKLKIEVISRLVENPEPFSDPRFQYYLVRPKGLLTIQKGPVTCSLCQETRSAESRECLFCLDPACTHGICSAPEELTQFIKHHLDEQGGRYPVGCFTAGQQGHELQIPESVWIAQFVELDGWIKAIRGLIETSKSSLLAGELSGQRGKLAEFRRNRQELMNLKERWERQTLMAYLRHLYPTDAESDDLNSGTFGFCAAEDCRSLLLPRDLVVNDAEKYLCTSCSRQICKKHLCPSQKQESGWICRRCEQGAEIDKSHLLHRPLFGCPQKRCEILTTNPAVKCDCGQNVIRVAMPCPHCGTMIMKIEGCDKMICGRDTHGSEASRKFGCGREFRWDSTVE